VVCSHQPRRMQLTTHVLLLCGMLLTIKAAGSGDGRAEEGRREREARWGFPVAIAPMQATGTSEGGGGALVCFTSYALYFI
jgi:hypothetical protein